MTRLLLGWDDATASPGIGFVRSAAAPSGEEGPITDDSESHVLAVAPTGKGKSRSLAIPNLLEWEGPAIVLDIKGELAACTADYRRDVLGQDVAIVDPWRIVTGKGGSLNPLDILRSAGDDMADQAYMLASMTTPNLDQVKDPFWPERGSALIAGLFTYAATALPDGHPGNVWELLASDTTHRLAQILDCECDLHPFAAAQIAGVLGTADVTRQGIISTAQSHMRVFAGATVQRSTDHTSFDLSKIRSGAPLTIYLVIPPACLVSHQGLVRVWISALMSLITSRRRRPAHATLFLLDEFGQLGALPQMVSAVTLGRSYGLRCMFFLQSYSQLRSVYPEDHDTFIENCGTVLTWGHTRRSMSDAMAHQLGDVSADTLARLPGDRLAVKRAGEETRILRRLDYLQDALFQGRYRDNPMFLDAELPIEQPPTPPAAPATRVQIGPLQEMARAFRQLRGPFRQVERLDLAPPDEHERLAALLLAMDQNENNPPFRTAAVAMQLVRTITVISDATSQLRAIRGRYLSRADAILSRIRPMPTSTNTIRSAERERCQMASKAAVRSWAAMHGMPREDTISLAQAVAYAVIHNGRLEEQFRQEDEQWLKREENKDG